MKEERDVSPDLLQETERFWEDPEKVMHLIDLLFLFEDEDKAKIYS